MTTAWISDGMAPMVAMKARHVARRGMHDCIRIAARTAAATCGISLARAIPTDIHTFTAVVRRVPAGNSQCLIECFPQMMLAEGAPDTLVTLLQVRRLHDVGDPLGGRDKGTPVEKRGRKATELTQKFCYASRVTERVIRPRIFK